MLGLQENIYRILMFWNRTPEELHSFKSEISGTYWRYKSEEGTLLHIFWSFSAISSFWEAVLELLEQQFGVLYPSSPLQCLLGLPFPGILELSKQLALHVVTVAKRRISLLTGNPLEPNFWTPLQKLKVWSTCPPATNYR